MTQFCTNPNPIWIHHQRLSFCDSSVHLSHHDQSPCDAKRWQEDLRPDLVRDDGSRRLEDGVGDEEDERRDVVAISNVRVEIVVHARDLEDVLSMQAFGGEIRKHYRRVGQIASVDQRNAVHQSQDHDQATVDTVNNLPLFGV